MRTPALHAVVAAAAIELCALVPGTLAETPAIDADDSRSAPAAAANPGARERSWRIVTATPLGPDLSVGLSSEAAYRRGVTALFAGDAGEAAEAFQQSIETRPDRTSAHVLLGTSLLLARSHRALGEIPPAVRAFLADFECQTRLGLNLLSALVAGIVLLLFGRLVPAILRAIPLAVHEIVESLPRSLPRGVRGAYPIVLLALPIALWRPWAWPAGLVWSLVFYALLVRRHFVRPEAATLAALGGLVVLSPAIFVLAGLLAAPAAPRSVAFSLAHAREPLLRDYVAGELESSLRWAPDDADVAFQLALLRREQGRANDAVALYERIPESAAAHAAARVNSANILFARGETAQALDNYRGALARRPGSAPGHYDLSQALLEGFEFGEAKSHLHKAAAINFDLMQSLSRASLEAKETLLVDETLRARDRWRWLLAHRREMSQVTPKEAIALATDGLRPPTAAGGALLVLLLAAALVAGQLSRRAEPCATCGNPVCRICRVRLSRRSFCDGCSALASQEGPHDAIEEERRARVRRARGPARVVGLLLAIFLPGAGHVFAGRRALGSAILFVAGASIFLLATKGGPISAIPRLDGELVGAARPALFLFLVNLHLVGIVHFFTVARRRLS